MSLVFTKRGERKIKGGEKSARFLKVASVGREEACNNGERCNDNGCPTL